MAVSHAIVPFLFRSLQRLQKRSTFLDLEAAVDNAQEEEDDELGEEG
jgi:hypothetical protein